MAAVLFCLCLALRLQASHHRHLADDAFITFRYAANVASGQGFVYNPGERVLGTTTPLLTLLLAGAEVLGLDAAWVGRWLCLLASALCCSLLWYAVWLSTGSAMGGAAGAALLALSGSQAQIGTSGMEAPLMGALMLGSYLCLQTGRHVLAGLLIGLVALTRPEGLAWLLPAIVFLRTGKRRSVPALAVALLLPAAWLAFAWLYFGSPVPQSMLAKIAQGHAVAGDVVATAGALLGPLGPVSLLGGFCIAGIWLAARGRLLLTVPLVFCAGFLCAYALGRPMLYPWYCGPLDVAASLVIGTVMGHVAEWTRRQSAAASRRGLIVGVPAAAAFALLLSGRTGDHYGLLTRKLPPEPHRQLAQWLSEHTRTGETILVGDVGYVGYYNLERRVVDYCGLVWRAPADLLRGAMGPDMGARRVTSVVAALQPDILAVHISNAPDAPPAGYTQSGVPGLGDYQILVRERPWSP